MGGSSDQVVGYKYYAKFAAFIGNRIELLHGINFDKRGWVLKDKDDTRPYLEVRKSSLYGETEGGVSGIIDIQLGTPGQQPSLEYQKYFPLVSGYPYQSHLVFHGGVDRRGFYLGNSGHMKEMLLWPKRIHVKNNGEVQWYDDKAEIPEGGGVEQPEITPDTSPLPAPENIATRFSWADQYDYIPKPETELLPASYLSSSSFQINGKSISGMNGKSPEFVPGWAYLSSVTELPYARYVGEAFIARSPFSGITLAMTGGTRKESTDAYHLYDVDFVGTKFEVQMSGSNVTAIGMPQANFLRYAAVEPSVFTGDINPIHKIREILTDDIAMHKPESDINDFNFRKAADRIWNEGLGISWALDEKSCIEAIEELCHHIEAGIRVNRQTGKFEMVLFRDDWFASEDIHTIEEKHIKSMSLEVQNSDELINQLNVSFYDRQNIKRSSFSVEDNGSILTIGKSNTESIDFPYFMNQRNAEIASGWKLKQLSTPCWKGSFSTGWKTARKWNRYDLIRLPWSKKWGSTTLVRIMKINLGTGSGVTIDFVEVVPYSGLMNTSIVVDESLNQGVLPPQQCNAKVFELPYFEAVQAFGEREINVELSDNPEAGYLCAIAEKPQDNSLNALLYVDDGDGFERSAVVNYCETAYLDQSIDRITSIFTVKNIGNIESVRAGSQIFVNDEIMVFQSYQSDSKALTVKRGAFGSPQNHPADSILFFADDFIAIDKTMYVDSEIISAKVLTTTPSGLLSTDIAESFHIEMNARAIRPYPPANVKINDEYWPEYFSDDFIITWSDRNRLQQTGGVPLGYFESSVALEENTQTLLTIVELDASNLELATHSENVTALNSYTLLESAMQAQTRSLHINLKTVRDDYECMYAFDHTAIRSMLIPPTNVTFEAIEY